MVLDHYEKSKYQKVSVLQKINLFNEGVNGKSRPHQRLHILDYLFRLAIKESQVV